MRTWTFALCCALTASFAWADQVTLTNGDRITGSIIKSDTKELVLESPTAGTVKVQWAAITAISAPGPVFVNLTDRQTVAGAVELANGQIRVQSQTAGLITAPAANITALRNQAEQTAFETEVERLRNPRLIDLWTGFLDVGFAGAKGNANTGTFTLSTRADRVTNRDKISVYFTSIYSSSDVPTGVKTATANAKRGGITYDVNLNKKWFAWGAVDLESNEFQFLDLRFVPAGGLGHHTVNTDRTKLDFRLGISGNREFFSTGERRTSAEMILGNDFQHKFTEKTVLEEHLRYFINLSEGGAYRINFDTTFATALKTWLSLQLTLSDRYLSNPVGNRKNNDLLYSAGVRLTFAR
jgi:putative salt-induced outer membrane protein YdiY